MGKLGIDEDAVKNSEEIAKDEFSDWNVALDILGQSRKVSVENLNRMPAHLDPVQLAVVMNRESKVYSGETGGSTFKSNVEGREEAREASRQNNGIRDENFYMTYFNDSINDVEVFTTPVDVQNLGGVLDTAREVYRGLENHPEYSVGYSQFGIGFQNEMITGESLDETLDEMEEQLGIQIFFGYEGDADALEEYGEFQNNYSFLGGSVEEGITGVICLGREEVPEVYMAGHSDIDVEMEGVPGYDGKVDVDGIRSLN